MFMLLPDLVEDRIGNTGVAMALRDNLLSVTAATLGYEISLEC